MLRLRRANADDLARVLRFAPRAREQSHWKDDLPYSAERTEQMFKLIVGNDNQRIFILLDDEDEVRGMLIAHLEAAYLTMSFDAVESLLYLEPAHRSIGAVRLLIEALEAWATTAGATAVRLTTSHIARAPQVGVLYSRYGYRVCDFSFRKVLK